MKKSIKILTVSVMLLAAAAVRAQVTNLLLVDLTTRTNIPTWSSPLFSITNTSVPFTNSKVTVSYPNNTNIGDSFPAAFFKINGDILILSNLFASGVSGGGGGSNFIHDANGTGTNTTLYWPTIIGSPSISVTNIGVFGLIDLHDNWITNVQGIALTRGVTLYGDDRTEPYGTNSIYIGQGGSHPYGEFNTFIAGGSMNDIGLSGNSAAIVAGWANRIGSDTTNTGSFAFVGGGLTNTVSGNSSVVLGGDVNLVSGVRSGIVGGRNNILTGQESFAAGSLANGTNNNVFIWNDGSSGQLSSKANNQFLIHAAGGVQINRTGVTTYAVDIYGGYNTDVGYYINGVPVTDGYALLTDVTNIVGEAHFVKDLGGFGTNETFYGSNIISGAQFYVQTNITRVDSLTSITALVLYGCDVTNMNITYQLVSGTVTDRTADFFNTNLNRHITWHSSVSPNNSDAWSDGSNYYFSYASTFPNLWFPIQPPATGFTNPPTGYFIGVTNSVYTTNVNTWVKVPGIVDARKFLLNGVEPLTYTRQIVGTDGATNTWHFANGLLMNVTVP